MPGYNLIDDFDVDDGDGDSSSVSVNPYWLMVVVRLNTPLSFSRYTMQSVSADPDVGGQSAGSLLIIGSDCISLQINNSKGSHVKNLSATLKHTDTNYRDAILPGDWVLAWIVNDRDSVVSVLDRLRVLSAAKPTNEFKDGLKFVGRVNSCVRHKQTDANGGAKTLSYALSAFAFKELDTSFFYDPSLASEDQGIGRWQADMGKGFMDIFTRVTSDANKDNVNDLIPLLIDTIVGTGIAAISNQATHVLGIKATPIVGAVTTKEAPFSYVIPVEVCTILGITGNQFSKDHGVSAYADILHLLTGVQKYYDGNNGDIANFIPTLPPLFDPRRLDTKNPMMGFFYPVEPNFANIPLWSLLQSYLNPTMNEMYTCMRVNTQNRVFPTVVLRQLPFTTDAFNPETVKEVIASESAMANILPDSGTPTVDTRSQAEIRGSLSDDNDIQDKEFTRFTELPRWVIDDILVRDEAIGRSETTRCNFVHVYGAQPAIENPLTVSAQIAVNPPRRDDIDIQRSGLHAFMGTVNCKPVAQAGKSPSKWLVIIADRLMGHHLTLNGTLTLLGIHLPICEGDNAEHLGIVYHIESVTHTCSISGEGVRHFSTTLTLTNGLKDGVTLDGNGNVAFPHYVGLDDEEDDTLGLQSTGDDDL